MRRGHADHQRYVFAHVLRTLTSYGFDRMKLAFVFLLLLTLAPALAQSDPHDKEWSASGSLYVLVDSSATIYINGAKVKIPKSKAAPKAIPVTFHSGDRLVAQLSSVHSKGNGYFMLLFVSAQKNAMISFRAVSFKILPDPLATDFTEGQFSGFLHEAVPRFHLEEKQSLFPYKNNCEGFWGDRDQCAVGALISADMSSPMSPE
jgi:hypothetical protein